MQNETPAQRSAAEVRAALAREQITRSAVAKHLGHSRAAMTRRLSGEIPLNVNELAALAVLLDVPVSTFLPDPEQAIA